MRLGPRGIVTHTAVIDTRELFYHGVLTGLDLEN